jgi:hypothetical protein
MQRTHTKLSKYIPCNSADQLFPQGFSGLKARIRSFAGILRIPSGAKWNNTKTHEVYSIVPEFTAGDKTPPFTTRLATPRPSEVELYVDVRPPVPPSTRPRICLRSTQVLKTACGAGASKRGSPNLAVSASETDPESPLFPVGRLGAPLGPCLEVSADGKRGAASTSKSPEDATLELILWQYYHVLPCVTLRLYCSWSELQKQFMHHIQSVRSTTSSAIEVICTINP